MLSVAELIELESWALKLRERFDRAAVDWDSADLSLWVARYPELPLYPPDRQRLYENLRTLLKDAQK